METIEEERREGLDVSEQLESFLSLSPYPGGLFPVVSSHRSQMRGGVGQLTPARLLTPRRDCGPDPERNLCPQLPLKNWAF